MGGALCLGAAPYTHAQMQTTYSTNTTGMIGLNTIPTARMDDIGTTRLHLSTVDPYIHAAMGFQIIDPLYINLRQTSEISSVNDFADRIYPGIDFKLRLLEEGSHSPEIAIGANAAFGHKRLSSEYVAFSKRYKTFDFTGGIGWGRMGSAGHFSNPLQSISSHFEKKRDYQSEDPQNISNWFTGDQIGLFGGVEYFTPLKGLSLKAEYCADDYTPETQSSNYNAPAPWSVGVNYQPWEFIDLSVAAIGTDKLMGRLSLQGGLNNWIGRPREYIEPAKLSLSTRETNTFDQAHVSARSQKIRLYNTQMIDQNVRANLVLSEYASSPRQIGHALRHLSNNTTDSTSNYTLALHHKGLRGPDIQIIRHDFENAALSNGSAEEIWQDASFETKNLIKTKPKFDIKNLNIKFILDNRLSLTEDDFAPLYRSSGIVEAQYNPAFGLITGISGKMDIKNNLEGISTLRQLTNLINPAGNKGGRSNIEEFAAERFTLERSYGAWLKSINPNLHFGFTGGLLEEMYGGLGGEILYRPFGKTFAVGAEIWQVSQRDPETTLALGRYDDIRTTGHLNFWYEAPNKNTTFYARLGRYLAQDTGATLGVKTMFKNGTSLDAFLTGSNQSDRDVFGGATDLYSGVRFNVPFGNIPYVPDGSEARFQVGQMGRDTGQHLDKPISLYEITEPMSYRHLSQNWTDLPR